MSQQPISEKIYDFLTEEDEPRACEAIPDEACTNVAANFSLNVANGASTKLAEQIISPSLTLPWILSFLGAPSFMVGLLVPIKNAGSLLPQLVVSGKIRSYAVRKYFWVAGALVQAVCMLLSALVIWLLSDLAAAWFILLFLLLFSIASGVASIAFKDVVAKTIPKGKRGQMLAARASIGGVLTLAAGLTLYFLIGEEGSKNIYGWLFISTSFLWFLAAFLFYLIREEKGATEGGRTPIKEIGAGWKLLKKDANLRNFIITRALLMAIPLATPFYVVIGKNTVSDTLAAFGLLIVTNGLANIISSPFWGRYADRSSRKMMMLTAGLGILTALYVLLFPFLPDTFQSIYSFIPVFFLNGMAHAGARLSRKTYLVDFAPEKERPLYVSLSNTLIGLFTFVAAGIGFISELISTEAQIIFFAFMLLSSLFLSLKLKEV